MTPREEGSRARRGNRSIDSSPYYRGSLQWQQWRAGWRDEDFRMDESREAIEAIEERYRSMKHKQVRAG